MEQPSGTWPKYEIAPPWDGVSVRRNSEGKWEPCAKEERHGELLPETVFNLGGHVFGQVLEEPIYVE